MKKIKEWKTKRNAKIDYFHVFLGIMSIYHYQDSDIAELSIFPYPFSAITVFMIQIFYNGLQDPLLKAYVWFVLHVEKI